MRRLGLIGDVHAEDEHLEQALQFLRQQVVDQILCTGDVVDGRGDANRCCRLLQEQKVVTVRGNHDRWLLENSLRDSEDLTQLSDLDPEAVHFIRSLPETAELQTPAGLLLLCHGLPGNDMAQLRPDDFGYAIDANLDLQRLLAEARYPLVVNGHTHWRMVRRFLGATIINAGTLHVAHDPCCAVIDFETGLVLFSNIRPGGDTEPVARLSYR